MPWTGQFVETWGSPVFYDLRRAASYTPALPLTAGGLERPLERIEMVVQPGDLVVAHVAGLAVDQLLVSSGRPSIFIAVQRLHRLAVFQRQL